MKTKINNELNYIARLKTCIENEELEILRQNREVLTIEEEN